VQVTAVAFIFTQGFGYRFDEHAHIGQVFELLIIITDKVNNFPVAAVKVILFTSANCSATISFQSLILTKKPWVVVAGIMSMSE